MADQFHLKNSWPYDEIEAVILTILEDGTIDSKEHRMMLHFFDEISTFKKYRKTNPKVESERMVISGVCAICPDVFVNEKVFCITGKSERLSRRKIAEIVAERGGFFTDEFSRNVDYLVVCSGGNKAWGFACYG
jgi:NAD-dependent DNA ligase